MVDSFFFFIERVEMNRRVLENLENVVTQLQNDVKVLKGGKWRVAEAAMPFDSTELLRKELGSGTLKTGSYFHGNYAEGLLAYQKAQKAERLSADGIFDTLRSGAINLMRTMPPNVESFVKRYGNLKLLDVTVLRVPVNKMLLGILNVLPGTNVKGTLYHLFQVLHLETEKYLRLDKDEVVKIEELSRSEFMQLRKDFESMTVQSSSLITFKEYVEKAENVGGLDFWRYDAIKCNCQVFVKDCLRGSGLWSSEIEKFVLQTEVGGMFSSGTKHFMNAVTDTAGTARQLGSFALKKVKNLFAAGDYAKKNYRVNAKKKVSFRSSRR